MCKPSFARHTVHIAAAVLVAALVATGCGSSAPTRAPAPASTTASPVVVPPGVDSTTARQADSLADEAFVSLEQQRVAAAQVEVGDSLVRVSDSLWEYLEIAGDTTAADSAGADTLSRQARTRAVRAYNKGAKSLQEYVEVSRAAEIDSARLRRMQADLLQAAQTAFEEAIQANPYDDATRSRLAQVYRLRGERLGQEQAYDKAIEMYEKLARLQQDSPSLFVALANLYYDTEQYRESAVNYRKARKAYVTSVELSLEDSTQVDSTRLYQYAQAEANAYRFARNAERALAAYREAKAVAATSAQRTTMQNWIDWVNWDDGNISASFARDSLKGLAAEGKAEAAAEGFRSLKARLQTASARYEVDWRLAQAEYQMGKRKQAADRMQRLVNQLDVKGDGTPADSSHQRYLDAYGTICLNMGRRMRREDLRAALKYYKQSAEVAWERRSLAELEVGRLLRNDVEASIRYLERALSRDGTLETENQLRLYRTLVNQHRRLGHREEARTYRKKYMALRRKASAGR